MKKEAETVIISGANGFIGSLLADKFFKEGYRVYALVKGNRNINLIENKSTVIDFDDIETLKEKLKGTNNSIFYHLAWQGVNGPDRTNIEVQLNNIELGMAAAKTACQAGCSKFLCAGSIAERGLESLDKMETVPGGMMYAAAKQALRCLLDTYCRQAGLNHIWMQLSNVYGPSNKTGSITGYALGKILYGQEALFGPASQPYDLIYMDDLIEAVYRLGISDTRKHFYFVGSGTPRILKSYLKTIGKITGKSGLIKIGACPDDGIKYSMDMFSADDLKAEIGNYVSGDFESSMQYTAAHYFDDQRVRGKI